MMGWIIKSGFYSAPLSDARNASKLTWPQLLPDNPRMIFLRSIHHAPSLHVAVRAGLPLRKLSRFTCRSQES
jgi:hypothetical protein